MCRYVIRRLIMLIPVLLGVLVFTFLLSRLTPGDPVMQLLSENATEEDYEAKREELGLNRPLIVQFGDYVLDLVTKFDLGTSYSSKQAVSQAIAERFPTTALLAVISILCAVVIGIPTGILSAVYQNSILDYLSKTLALVGVSMPNFWQGLMNILIFSIYFGWLPASGFYGPSYWVLPAITVGTSTAAIITRMTRSSMLEVIRQDYVRTARAKGQKESVVILRHVMKNALIPIITVIGIQFGGLLGGAVLTESIFAVPGLGKYMVDAIKARDYPVIQGGVVVLALTFSVVNLLIDIIYAYADPRIKSLYSSPKAKKLQKGGEDK